MWGEGRQVSAYRFLEVMVRREVHLVSDTAAETTSCDAFRCGEGQVRKRRHYVVSGLVYVLVEFEF